jgi:hypothetical protein
MRASNATGPLSLPSTIAFSSEVHNGWREENASKHEFRAEALAAIAGFHGRFGRKGPNDRQIADQTASQDQAAEIKRNPS